MRGGEREFRQRNDCQGNGETEFFRLGLHSSDNHSPDELQAKFSVTLALTLALSLRLRCATARQAGERGKRADALG